MAPDLSCTLPIDFSLYAQNGTLVVTLINQRLSVLAVNWARQLATIGLRGTIGVTSRLDQQAEQDVLHAGAGIFCTTSAEMRIQPQAGRWAELVALLRTGFDILLSDVDVGWARNPLPYIHAVLHAHPQASILFSSNLGDGNFSTTPLHGANAEGLELEDPDAYRLGINLGDGFNVGILFVNQRSAHRAFSARLERMFARWVELLSARSDGQLRMASFDQGIINRWLHSVMRPRSSDANLIDLALNDESSPGREPTEPPLAIGCLPALQFSTAHIHFAWRAVRARHAPPPFAIHATCTLGRALVRKIWVLREAGVWHDPPSYQRRPDERFLRLETINTTGAVGFELISKQLQQVAAALHLARALNRSLILPHLVCGTIARSHPCRAGAHLWKGQRPPLPLPEYCPLHYWVEPVLAEQSPVPIRPPSFLAADTMAGMMSKLGTEEVYSQGGESLHALQKSWLRFSHVRVLSVRNLPPLVVGSVTQWKRRKRTSKTSAQHLWPALMAAGRSPNEMTWDAWCRTCDSGIGTCLEHRIS